MRCLIYLFDVLPPDADYFRHIRFHAAMLLYFEMLLPRRHADFSPIRHAFASP